jgi:hypothetical protein
MERYSFVRCSTGQMEPTYKVTGKVGDMACRQKQCSGSGSGETAVGEMVHGQNGYRHGHGSYFRFNDNW